MSAFIVNRAHIDALVKVALDGPSDMDTRRETWFAPRWNNMRVNYIVASELGEALIGANLLSVNYPEQYWREDYSFPFSRNLDPSASAVRHLTAVEALKAINCFAYQACEHEYWEHSAVKLFLDELTRQLVSLVPGYADAPWVIE